MNNIIKDLKELLERRRYKQKTVKAYLHWIHELENYYGRQNILNLNDDEIKEFVNYLSQKRRLAVSSVKQAIFALCFYYENVAKKSFNSKEFKLGWIARPIPEIPSQIEILLSLAVTILLFS